MRGLFSSQEMLEIESYLTGRATPHPNPWVQRGGDRKFRLFACTLLPFVLLSLVCVGCTPRIIPPAMPRNAVPIYVADYGRHSSLILPDDKTGPTVRSRFLNLGADVPEPQRRGPTALAELVRSEIARLTPLLESAMAKP